VRVLTWHFHASVLSPSVPPGDHAGGLRGENCRYDGGYEKAIRNLSAFLNWAGRNRFVAAGLEVRKVKVAQKPVVALSPQQVRDLLTAASKYPAMRLRVLLAVTTGLRRGDIEAIGVGDIHFDRNTITTQNRKAGKAMAERPVPKVIMTELSNYVATLPDGREKLFMDRFSPKKWERIRRAATLPGLKFHDLRKTFASLLAQRGVSTAVTQRLLEHSSPQLKGTCTYLLERGFQATALLGL